MAVKRLEQITQKINMNEDNHEITIEFVSIALAS